MAGIFAPTFYSSARSPAMGYDEQLVSEQPLAYPTRLHIYVNMKFHPNGHTDLNLVIGDMSNRIEHKVTRIKLKSLIVL